MGFATLQFGPGLGECMKNADVKMLCGLVAG